MDPQIHSLMLRLREAPGDASCLHALRRCLLQRSDFLTLSRCLHFVAHHTIAGLERADLLYEAAQLLRLDTEADTRERTALLREALCQEPRHLAALEALCIACQDTEDATYLVGALGLVVERAQARTLPPAHYTDILIRLAEAYAFGLRQPQGALECYREILRLDPENEEAPRQLAHLLVHRELGPQPQLAPCPPLREGEAIDAWLEQACLNPPEANTAQAVHPERYTGVHPFSSRTAGWGPGQPSAGDRSIGVTDFSPEARTSLDPSAHLRATPGTGRKRALSEDDDHDTRALTRDALNALAISQARRRAERKLTPKSNPKRLRKAHAEELEGGGTVVLKGGTASHPSNAPPPMLVPDTTLTR